MIEPDVADTENDGRLVPGRILWERLDLHIVAIGLVISLVGGVLSIDKTDSPVMIWLLAAALTVTLGGLAAMGRAIFAPGGVSGKLLYLVVNLTVSLSVGLAGGAIMAGARGLVRVAFGV